MKRCKFQVYSFKRSMLDRAPFNVDNDFYYRVLVKHNKALVDVSSVKESVERYKNRIRRVFNLD